VNILLKLNISFIIALNEPNLTQIWIKVSNQWKYGLYFGLTQSSVGLDSNHDIWYFFVQSLKKPFKFQIIIDTKQAGKDYSYSLFRLLPYIYNFIYQSPELSLLWNLIRT